MKKLLLWAVICCSVFSFQAKAQDVDIYTIGNGVVYKNGSTLYTLSGSGVNATGLFVYQEDVYVIGQLHETPYSSGDVAVVWKNGVIMDTLGIATYIWGTKQEVQKEYFLFFPIFADLSKENMWLRCLY
ncbi:MAG: hypothetical protein LBU51_09860 [Bacteroidales bacterium]|jgi:hypothetical protein|nr:hypothetical protein [Bacteroidales bacterium]